MARMRRKQTGQRRAHPILSIVVVPAILGLLLYAVGGCGASGEVNKPSVPPTRTTATSAKPAPTGPTEKTSPPRQPTSPATRTSPAPPKPSPTPSRPEPAPKPRSGTALSVLAKLPVKGRAPKTGYNREQFGEAWSDDVNVPDGHNGCDTRNDILRRDLTHIVLKPNTNGCVVARGKLADPYTATLITFVRGVDTSAAVQIDHVVALSDAWQKGAQQLTPQRRADFANDPLNLLAVDGPANEQKGDGDAATWLPPNKSYRCAYVARQIAVKRKYRLWVTAAEKEAMQRVLSRCPGERVPTEGQRPHRVRPTATQPPPRLPRRTRSPGHGSGVYYPNCDAVRAAGRAPLLRGQPGYRPGLDRDGDGIACE
jgi:hypothetical protein